MYIFLLIILVIYHDTIADTSSDLHYSHMQPRSGRFPRTHGPRASPADGGNATLLDNSRHRDADYCKG